MDFLQAFVNNRYILHARTTNMSLHIDPADSICDTKGENTETELTE